jgi:hypothetical protein
MDKIWQKKLPYSNDAVHAMGHFVQFQKLTDGCRTIGDLRFDYFNRSLQILSDAG